MPGPSMQEMLAKLKKKDEAETENSPPDLETETQAEVETEVEQETEVMEQFAPAPNPAPVLTKKKLDVKFQHYNSSVSSMRMITKNGTHIIFVLGQFITSNPECINYLNAEIDLGLPQVTKGELMTAEEADPMAALKRRHIAEYLATKKLEEEELAVQAELASQVTTGIVSTSQVPTADESNS